MDSRKLLKDMRKRSIVLPLARVSLKMFTMETNSQNTIPIFVSLPSTWPSVSSLTQTPIPNVVDQNSDMQNPSGVSQNSVWNSMGQGVPSSIFANSQRQMQGRHQVLPQQQYQQSQNPQQYLYQQQLQQQLLKQKFRQGNLTPSLMSSHIQQQQQNLLQPTQLQSSQQSGLQTSSVMQPSAMQSAPLSSLQQNQQSSVQQATLSMLQQHPQQAAGIHSQQPPMACQSIMPQQQQQLMGQQSNATNMQQNQLIGQQHSVGDTQQQQLLVRQNFSNINMLIDQQKQLYQSRRVLPETSSTSLDSTAQTGHANEGDWQEEIYQKIKIMKEMYWADLNEMYQKIALKLDQHDSLPQQPNSEQIEKLKMFKTMLERLISFLQVSQSNVLPGFKDKLGAYEKQIVSFINAYRPRQLPPAHLHSMQQPGTHENQMDPQVQPMNVQGSVATMQHNSLSSLSGVSTAQQTMLNTLQLGSNLYSKQGNALSSLQQVAVGSLQQNPMSTPKQANVNTLSSQSGMNMLQPNINPPQSNSNMLQHQQGQQLLQTQQPKQQFLQLQMQQKNMQKQQLLQQQHQQMASLIRVQLQRMCLLFLVMLLVLFVLYLIQA